MRNNFKFNPVWNFVDDIDFYAAVSVMPKAFKGWPGLEITKDMEAKMPLELVTEMKAEAAEIMREEGADERYIRRRLRIPVCGITGDDEPEPEDFTEKESRRAERRKAEIKARRRKAQISEIQKRRKAKQDKDGEIWYLVPAGSNRMYGIHDSDLWKPLDKRR